MKIASLKKFRYENDGGDWGCKFVGIVKCSRGKITESTLQAGTEESPKSILTLRVNTKKVKLFAVGLPRLDVGEEVIIHKDDGEVVAIQVIRGDEVIFRFLMPQEKIRYGSIAYWFK